MVTRCCRFYDSIMGDFIHSKHATHNTHPVTISYATHRLNRWRGSRPIRVRVVTIEHTSIDAQMYLPVCVDRMRLEILLFVEEQYALVYRCIRQMFEMLRCSVSVRRRMAPGESDMVSLNVGHLLRA